MLHGYRYFSEEIFNEYAVQKCFSRAKSFQLKKGQKKPDFVCFFFIFKKSQKFSKRARILKSGFKKAKLATLLHSSQSIKSSRYVTELLCYVCD